MIIFDKGFVIELCVLSNQGKMNIVIIDGVFSLLNSTDVKLCSCLWVSVSEGIDNALLKGYPHLTNKTSLKHFSTLLFNPGLSMTFPHI